MEERLISRINNKTIETFVTSVLEELKRREPEMHYKRHVSGSYYIQTSDCEVLKALSELGYIHLEKVNTVYAMPQTKVQAF